MMLTNEVYDFLIRHIHGSDGSIIVTSRDKLPNKFKLPLYLIVNDDVHTGEGQHWSALWVSKQQHAIYLDSFGRPPFIEIRKFIDKHAKSLEVSSEWLQKVNSTSCGLYSCIFLVFCSRNKTLKEYLSNFCKNRELNELTVTSMKENNCINKF